MPLFARAVFGVVNRLAARGGLLSEESEAPADAAEAGRRRRRTGVRGESFAYWYLRRQGYTLVRRNYRSARRHGEIDLIGWDGGVLVFIEVKTRTTPTGGPPERTVDAAKQEELRAMARDYLARRRLGEVPCRFDLLALEARPGALPVVRLHKGAFGAE
ncbi:MAG: YraN family protein [Terriglobia bacterium]